MPRIAPQSVAQIRARINRFNPKYVADWNAWANTPVGARPVALRRVLARWQACRGNKLRDAMAGSPLAHPEPYISDLFSQAQPHIRALQSFDLRIPQTRTPSTDAAIRELWNIFEQLSYDRKKQDRKRPAPRAGRAGIVGISKAAMLVTDGRVGPAFDSVVRRQMGIRRIDDATQWLAAIQFASDDIVAFEMRNGCTLHSAANLSTPLHTGRVYDMVLGP